MPGSRLAKLSRVSDPGGGLEIVADEQGLAGAAQVMDLAGLVTLAGQRAFQVGDVDSRAVAVVEVGVLDLERAMLDPEAVVEHGSRHLQQGVGIGDPRRDEMGRHRGFGGAQRPDVEVMHRFDPIELRQLFGDLVELDALRARRRASSRPIRAAGSSCSTGSPLRRSGP